MVRMRLRLLIPMVAVLMSGLMAFAFGASGGVAMAQGASASVTIQNFAFSPGSIQVAAGTTVTWTNNDQTAHTVTADDGSFDSGDIQPGGTFSMTFNTPGTISYHCKIHPNMTASVVVMAAAQQSAAAATMAPAATTAPATTSQATTAANPSTSQATTTTMPVTGSGSAASPVAHSNGWVALGLALLAAALGVLASFRGARRR